MKHIELLIDKFASDVADYIISQASENIKRKGCFRLVLSGGRTPLSIFECLVDKQNLLDWSKVELYWLDERCVPIDSPESNFGNCFRVLIEKLDKKPEYYPMYEAGSAKMAAMSYEKLLKKKLGSSGLSFDLVLIGVGADGHVASIFTEDDCTCDSSWVMPTESPNLPYQRVTLTLPVINQVNVRLFIVKGSDKKWVFDACTSGIKKAIPACQVDVTYGETLWFTCFIDKTIS